MEVRNLTNLSISEKFLMLEELWEDLSKNAQNAGFTPSWHMDILESRENSVKNNNSKFDNFSNVKERLTKLANWNFRWCWRGYKTGDRLDFFQNSINAYIVYYASYFANYDFDLAVARTSILISKI